MPPFSYTPSVLSEIILRCVLHSDITDLKSFILPFRSLQRVTLRYQILLRLVHLSVGREGRLLQLHSEPQIHSVELLVPIETFWFWLGSISVNLRFWWFSEDLRSLVRLLSELRVFYHGLLLQVLPSEIWIMGFISVSDFTQNIVRFYHHFNLR